MAQKRDPTLAVAAAAVALLAALTALRLVLRYGHPDDRRSAWVPRGVAALGFALAACTLLLFPLDVANGRACAAQRAKAPAASPSLALTAAALASSCVEGVPSAALWRAAYISDGVMTFLIIPLAYFYYLGDAELGAGARLATAALWGFADVPVTVLASGAYRLADALGAQAELARLAEQGSPLPLDSCVHPSSSPPPPPPGTDPSPRSSTSPSPPPSFSSALSAAAASLTSAAGVEFRGRLCDAVGGRLPSSTWSARVTFPTYFAALLSTAGWALFLVFAGVGLVMLPADAFRAFAGRPRSTIPRSEYAKRAAALGGRASALRAAALALRSAGRSRNAASVGGGSDGSPRPPSKGAASAGRRIERELLILEDDSDALESVHPRGEDAALAWAATVAGHWLLLARGALSAAVSAAWVAHLAVAVFPQPPLSPALNAALEKLDAATPLLGSLAFAGLAFHLVAATVSGAAAVSRVFPLTRPHALRVGATHASALLFNAGLVLLASAAAVQFCAQAFAVYAGSGTAVARAFGADLRELRGLRAIYARDVFMYALLACCGLSVVGHVALGAKKWKRKRPERE
jgi:LMBR1 domain-containing protein 1